MTNILAQKAVLANLTISQWGARRLDKGATYEVLKQHGAEAGVGIFTKRLLGKDALTKINSIIDAARIYHNAHTQPWFDDGIRILPTALYMDYVAAMQGFKNEFIQTVEKFKNEYPKLIEDARASLGDMFNEADYPKAELIGAKYGFGIVILPCPDVGDFRSDIPEAEMAEIKADLSKRMEDQYRNAVQATALRIAETVGRMAERLKAYKPGSPGKRAEGTFRDSLIEHVRDLAELIPAFNLAGDEKLAGIHKSIVKKLCKFDAADLRDSDLIRAKVAKDADSILADVRDFMA